MSSMFLPMTFVILHIFEEIFSHEKLRRTITYLHYVECDLLFVEITRLPKQEVELLNSDF